MDYLNIIGNLVLPESNGCVR